MAGRIASYLAPALIALGAALAVANWLIGGTPPPPQAPAVKYWNDSKI